MKRVPVSLFVAVFFASFCFAQAEKPVVSEKQDVAIFALGYYGYNIPAQALGSIDVEIQKVFIDLGRFNVLGMTQRFSSGDVQSFIKKISEIKQQNMVIPEKYQFGEAIFTEADFNKLVNAFVIAVPVVTNYEETFDAKEGKYKVSIRTAVTFIDANMGKLIGVADIETSGSDKTSGNKASMDAVNGIPMSLQYEIRKIDQFQNKTRILSVSFGEIKMELGTEMGIMKGDEYAIKRTENIDGIIDEREAGLVVIKDAGKKTSTAAVLYSDIPLSKNTALQEIPRLGLEGEVFFKVLMGTPLTVPIWDYFTGESEPTSDNTYVVGLKTTVARGFYDMRPFAAVEIPLQGVRTALSVAMFPVNVLLGGEYNLALGRLSLAPSLAVGASYIYVTEVITGTKGTTEDTLFPHFGGSANVRASILLGRDLKIWGEGGAEYWLSVIPDIYSSYGGLSAGGGVTLKL